MLSLLSRFTRRVAIVLVALCTVSAGGSPTRADDAKRSLRALLVTGGCCHDYGYQAERLVEGSAKIANIEWTVLRDYRRGKREKIDLYDAPWWAEAFDVVVHNECFTHTDDAEYIRQITNVHAAGMPAVVIHCAVHAYRTAEIDDWRELVGVTSHRYERHDIYPVTLAARGHPVMLRFPETWTSPKEELFIIDRVWPKTQILAFGTSKLDGRSHAAFWTNTYGAARVFGTTFGHTNATFDDEVFLDTLTRGILWAAGELTDAGEPSPGLEPEVLEEPSSTDESPVADESPDAGEPAATDEAEANPTSSED